MATSVQPSTSTPPQPEPTGFFGRFAVLGSAMPELWVVFAIKFIAVAAYAVMNSTLKLWLTADLGYGDASALYIVATWSILMTVFTILVGSLTDAIGLRRAFLLGVMVCIFARLVMAVATVKWLILVGGLLPLALGEALGTPVLVAAVRCYSTTQQRSISFSIFYMMMNVGFFISGIIFDFLRGHLGEHAIHTLPLVHIHVSTYQALLLASLVLELILLPIIYFGIREGVQARDDDAPQPLSNLTACLGCGYSLKGNVSGICPECGLPVGQYPPVGFVGKILLTVRRTVHDTGHNLASLASQSGFYRLLGFLMLIAFVKLIYMQMYYAYPTFGIRELGPGAPIGTLWSVTNSVLIIVLVPIVGVMTQKVSAYRAVTIGSAISAAAIFILALPPQWFQGMADGWFGHVVGHVYLKLTGPVSPWYVSLFFFVVLLSIGEAFYSPRVYEYAASIAPKGQEASYGALSYVPFFLAKLIVGVVSGNLLKYYCPETGPRDSSTMWLIIALIATVAPVGLLVFRRWIRVQEAGRE